MKVTEKEERELMERRFHTITSSTMCVTNGRWWLDSSLADVVVKGLRCRRNITRVYQMIVDLGEELPGAIEAIRQNPACPPKLAALLTLQKGVGK